MSETIMVVVCAVAGSFCGQLAANLLFPAVTLSAKKAQLSWMKSQEEMNHLIWRAIRGIQLRTAPPAERERLLKAMQDIGDIQPLDLRNEGTK